MEIAQIMSNPVAPASPGGETSGSANTGATADLFLDKLFASLFAADASSEGLKAKGRELLAGDEGMHPEESKKARMAEQKKYPAMLLPVADTQALDEEITTSPESSGLVEKFGLHLKETGSGVHLEVFQEEENSTVAEGEADEGGKIDQRGFMTAVTVLQNLFANVASEADRGIPAPLETAAARIAGWGEGFAENEKAVPENLQDANAGQISLDQRKMQAQSSEADGIRLADKVKDLTSLPAAPSPGGTSADQPPVKQGELPITEVAKTAGGKGDVYSQISMSASATTVSTRGTAFSKVTGTRKGTDPQESHRNAEETKGMEGNGMGSARLSPKTGDTEASMSRDDFSRQENKGSAASREFSVKQDLAGNFEVLNTASGNKPDAVSLPIDKGSLNETILRQVREKLAASLPEKDTGKVTLRLNPRELGDLTIDIRMENQKVAIDVTAQNPVVKEALMQHLDTLKETLTRQNITMERFDVSTGTGQGADHSSRQERQPAQQQTNGTAFPFDGYYLEETAQVRHTDWLPRENALVDMRW
ncbi:MAG: flagellar hook-length control protein FliK [Geobacteraceae bacterium]|nr:flagellar hook-length control protein FliK [Geobacteraceae bacterium]